MADLTQTLIAAQRADRAAEARLQESVATNYPDIARLLALEIATDGKPLASRQMASIFFKNTLNAKSNAHQNELHSRWKSVDPSVRQAVKDSLLQAICSQEQTVAHYAAIAASEVACVELPYGEWSGFVNTMNEMIHGPNTPESVKHAALECLGLTCARIEEVQEMLPEVPDLPEQTVNALLTAIVQAVNVDKTNEIRFQGLQALSKSLNFVHKNMEVQAERDFIMKNALCEATKSDDARLRKLAFQSLDVVAELYYDKLNDYMTDIFNLTTNAIANDTDEEVKRAAIEFWCTVALCEQQYLEEEEQWREAGGGGAGLDRPPCNKYVATALKMLVPLLLQTLTTQSDDADEDTYGLRETGATCLEAMAQTVGDMIVPEVIPFVQQHIKNENWRLRDAAIFAFACILEGPNTNILSQYVQQSIGVLLEAFGDPQMMVKDSATHCIGTICRLHIHACQPDQVHMMIQGLIAKLKESPVLAKRACTAIFNIGLSLKCLDPVPETNLLSAPMYPLMQGLMAVMDRADAYEVGVHVAAMSAAGELVAASAKDSQPILRELLPEIVGRVETTMKWQVLSNDDKENQYSMLGLLSGLITMLYQRLDKASVLGHTDRVMDAILKILGVSSASCHEEALLTTGAIATQLEGDFQKYMAPLMEHVVAGLKNFQAYSLCNTCVGLVVDICAAVDQNIQPYCDAIMTALTECLKDGSANRDLKPAVFSCFGDIALAIGAAFEPYLQVSTMLLMQAAHAQIQPDDDELADFVNSLRLSILDAYTGIIMGLSDGGKLHLFMPSMQGVMQFLQFLSMPESFKDGQCLEKAVALIGDMVHEMGKDGQVKQLVNQPFVMSLIQEAASSTNDKTREIANWTHSQVRQI